MASCKTAVRCISCGCLLLFAGAEPRGISDQGNHTIQYVSAADFEQAACWDDRTVCSPYAIPDPVGGSAEPTSRFIHVQKAGGSSMRGMLTAFQLQKLLGGNSTKKQIEAQARRQVRTRKIIDDKSIIGRLGFCEQVDEACFYFTVLRDPIERWISDHHYYCALGKENAANRLWAKEWKELGRCPLNVAEWMVYKKRMICSNFLSYRLTFGCPDDKRAAESNGQVMKAAKHNLMHGCMRYLLMSSYDDGLKRLSTDYWWLKGAFPEKAFRYNTHGSQKRYSLPPGALSRMQEVLQPDIELYQFAVDNYEKQWGRRLNGCGFHNTGMRSGSFGHLDEEKQQFVPCPSQDNRTYPINNTGRPKTWDPAPWDRVSFLEGIAVTAFTVAGVLGCRRKNRAAHDYMAVGATIGHTVME